MVILEIAIVPFLNKMVFGGREQIENYCRKPDLFASKMPSYFYQRLVRKEARQTIK
jgi:hypothetical protein